MSDFKKAAPQSEIGATKASARLPGLNIEIVHRQSPDGDSEQISISLQAVPSFAFGRFLEAANPFAFWVHAGRLAWLPWLEAVRAAIQPFSSCTCAANGPLERRLTFLAGTAFAIAAL